MQHNWTSRTSLLLIGLILLVVNLISVNWFGRVDLTDDQVYSLSEASVNTVENLDDPVTIKSFFTDDLPAPYSSNRRFLKDKLDEYRAYGGQNLQYEFVDPANDVYLLSENSPCIDAGDPDSEPDEDGSVADMGVFPFDAVFQRGDANGNGDVSALTDALFLLDYGFLQGDAPPCADAADVDDDSSPTGPVGPTPSWAICRSRNCASSLSVGSASSWETGMTVESWAST